VHKHNETDFIFSLLFLLTYLQFCLQILFSVSNSADQDDLVAVNANTMLFVERHLVDKTFCRRNFVEKFSSKVFCRKAFRRQNISSTRHFVEKFSLKSISSTDHFVEKHLVDGTLRRQNVLSKDKCFSSHFLTVRIKCKQIFWLFFYEWRRNKIIRSPLNIYILK
jgi:hypothetical protein